MEEVRSQESEDRTVGTLKMKNYRLKVFRTYFLIALAIICFIGMGCNSINEIFNNEDCSEYKNENINLKFSLDSLSSCYDSLYNDYNAIIRQLPDKNPDTVFVYAPVDSTNWIDSIRYVFRDSIIIVPHDTLIVQLKDSLVYIFKDTTVYNYHDSVIVSYDDRNFPTEIINKYLNLFFKSDKLTDATGLHFNVLIFDGLKLDYKYDSLYQVPDSVIGWRIDWYSKKCKIPDYRKDNLK
jgi:hypothetical protein